MKEENKRKGIIYLTIGVVTLLILVAGAAYAYFQAQVGNGTSFDVNATTGTTDVLSFLMSDINTSTDNIEDNHNKDSENENEEIVINASQDNFGENDKSLGDGVSAKAILKANNANNIAEQKYNVFFVIEEPKERLVYTQDEEHPELILTVIGPDKQEVKTIEGLKYHDADKDNPNDVSGFDITGRVGSFAIVNDYKIEVEEDTLNHQTEQEWKVKVTLVNLKENQNNNTGKEINGKVVITQDTMETYKQAHITSIKDTSSTVNSITTTMDYEKGSKEIKQYYFGIEEVGEVVAVDLEEVKWEEDDDATHTFKNLKDNYKYKVYCYIEDIEGIKSNIYETKVENLVTTEKLPKVKNIKVTSKSYDEIDISVESEKGTNEITKYEYTIKGATIENGERVEETTESTHTFTDLSEIQEYTIEVRIKDSKENYSVVSTITETTEEKPYHLKCNDDSGTCKIAKLSVNNNAIIYHDEKQDYPEEENYELEAGDLSYRYSGTNDNVNNYICFGVEECNEETNYDNLYRIIGIFKNNLGEYEIKLIKADSANQNLLGNSDAYFSNVKPESYYQGKNETLDYYFYSQTDGLWQNSPLNNNNLNNIFLNNLNGYQMMISNHYFQSNGCESSIYFKNNAKVDYECEIGVNQKGALEPEAKKVGLMYFSDYMYAADSKYWSYNGYTASNPENDYRQSVNDNWMYMGMYEWTISHNGDVTWGARINSGGVVSNHPAKDGWAVRPVFYLDKNVKLAGDGLKNSPYKIAE